MSCHRCDWHSGTELALLDELLREDVATILGLTGHGCAPGCRAANFHHDADEHEHGPECLSTRMKVAIAAAVLG